MLFKLTLPVGDPVIPVDDGVAFEVIDGSESVTSVLTFLVNAFRSVVNFLDSVVIFNDATLLDFHIAVAVFGILFAVLFVTVRSSVGNSISSVDRSRRSNRNRGDD